MASPHKIVIRREEGGGFAVAPDPCIAERPDLAALRPTHGAALRFASSLKIVKGWPIVDLSGGAP